MSNPWEAMLADLWAWAPSPPPIAEWLMAARKGEVLLVVCDTPRERSNVQSRVNRIRSTHNVQASATRCVQGVLVEKL